LAKRRAEQAEARRRQLIATALSLFAERGFDRTSIKDLAAATGVAPGLIYHYFRSKDELLFAVLEAQSFLPELRRLLAIAPDRPAADVLLEVAEGFSALIDERADTLRIVAREVQTDPHVLAALQHLIHEATELLAGYIDARIEIGELRPHDARVTARALFSVVVLPYLARVPIDGFLRPFVTTLLYGIAARQAEGD
jgi:AcrR family transcriptional regulator